MTAYTFNTITGVKDTTPVQITVTWKELVRLLTSYSQANATYLQYHSWQCAGLKKLVQKAKDGPGILPYTFSKQVRDSKYVINQTLLTLDIDCGLPVHEVQKILQDYSYIIYLSISSTPEKPKYRVIMPLQLPLSTTDVSAICHRIDVKLPDFNEGKTSTHVLDPVFDKKMQLYFLPMKLIDAPAEQRTWVNEGKLVNPSSFILSEAEKLEAKDMLTRVKIRQGEYVKERVQRTENAPSVYQEDGRYFLHPRAELKHELGYIVVGDVKGKISNVECPLHADVVPSEFMDIDHRGLTYLCCKACRASDKYRLIYVKEPGVSLDHSESVLELVLRTSSSVNSTELVDYEASTEVREEIEFQRALTEEERRALLKLVPHQLRDWNILSAGEGFGKSYLVKLLLEQGKRIIFACSSNNQADLKEEEIRAWCPTKIVNRVWSKSWNLQAHTDKDVVYHIGLLGESTIDDAETRLQVGDEDFETYYEAHHSELKEAWADADALVLTFAMAQQFLQRGMIEFSAKEVIVIVDDPVLSNLVTLQCLSQKYIDDLNRDRPGWIDKFQARGGSFETRLNMFCAIQPERTQFFHHDTIQPYPGAHGLVNPKILFTTTEICTAELLKVQHPGIIEIDFTHHIDAGPVTILGSQMVKSGHTPGFKTKNLLPYFNRVINKRCSTLAQLFSDSQSKHRGELEENINLSNNKGRNDFKDVEQIVVVISWPHLNKISNLVHELNNPKWDSAIVGRVIALDDMHQAFRNNGYRGDHECLVLCPPAYFDFLFQHCRYMQTAYSNKHGDFVNTAKKLKANTRLTTLVFSEPNTRWLQEWSYFLMTWPTCMDEDLVDLFSELADCAACLKLVEDVRKEAKMKWITEEILINDPTRPRRNVIKKLRKLRTPDAEETKLKKKKAAAARWAKHTFNK